MEKLYNNIILPDNFAAETSDASNVPYLKNPPKLINVSVGRQLFVDDFLIEKTELVPEYHKAVKYEGNPVLSPESKWEREGVLPSTCPKSGGVWFDEDERIYKMWYEAGWVDQMCYATSHDGIHWERPSLDIEPGTNKILTFDRSKSLSDRDPKYLRADSTTFWIDYDDPDVSRRYKMYLRNPGGRYPGIIGSSPDGIHWNNLTLTTDVGDRSTMFYNPFRKKWVYSIRTTTSKRRRHYHECDDLYAGAVWEPDKLPIWLCTDELDLPNPYIGDEPQLYNVDAVGYESIMLGMFEIHYGPDNMICAKHGVPKITELIPMYSRDGYNFSRPMRDTLVNASMYKGAWDRGYVQSVGGVTIIHGDELWIYYIGFGGDEECRFGVHTNNDMQSGMYKNGATGIAKLRRDGFVSMNGCGSLLTRRLEFTNKRELHVNINGSIKATILNDSGEVIAESGVFSGDSTDVRLDFDGFNVAAFEGVPFRLRFDVDGKLYSFGFVDEYGDFGGAHAAGIAE